MKYVYMDESGDLGFDSNLSSKNFTITLLVCGAREEQDLQRIIKKIRQNVLKKNLRNSPEMKWNNSPDVIRDKVFDRLSKINFEIFTIILDKSRVYDYLREKKHKLYNYLSNLIMNESSLDGDFKLVVDRSKNNRSLRDDFNRYIRVKAGNNSKISIVHEDSKSNGILQVLDFISGAIFNKYEFADCKYYNRVKGKIVTEKEFP